MRVDIVGAGPAGLAVAAGLQASPSNHDVHVWERNARVLTTPCGEGIRTDRLVLLAGFDTTPHIAAHLGGAVMDFIDGPRLWYDMPCVTLRRETWLPALAEHLERKGVKLHLGQPLSTGDIQALKGKVVVGADGPSSRVAEIVGNPRRFAPAAQVRIEGDPPIKDRLLFRYDPALSQEYAWVFPRGDHVSVGALAPATDANFQAFIELGRSYGVRGNLIKKESYPIPFGGTRVRRGRYALVGDAAGVANPITKGGIAPALIQAQLLARTLEAGGLAAYERACRRHPLFRRTSLQAIDALFRMGPTGVARIAGRAGEQDIRKRSTKLAWVWRAAWAGVTSPRLGRDAYRMARGLYHASDWGW